MSTLSHFPVFIVVSLLAFVGLLTFTVRHRPLAPSWARVTAVAAVLVVGGMLFAKFGANLGLPWWIYYGVPALLNLLLPPLAFTMSRREAAFYLCAALLVSPFIHAAFSFGLGWKEYMPFIPIPSAAELFDSAGRV